MLSWKTSGTEEANKKEVKKTLQFPLWPLEGSSKAPRLPSFITDGKILTVCQSGTKINALFK